MSVIILEDMDFQWQYPQMLKAAEMWKREVSIVDIAKELNRDPDEVLLLLLHLARVGTIDRRVKNLYGRG
jgi:Mn-dependent DtxR family transcriptional regulator